MPIISNTGSAAIDAVPTQKKGIVRPRAAAPLAPPPCTVATKGGNPLTKFLTVVAFILGLGMPPAVYFLGNFGGDSELFFATPNEVFSASAFELDLENYEKIASLAILTRRELELSITAIIQARTMGDPLTIATLETIVEKNERELERHKKRMATVLAESYQKFSGVVDQLEPQFENAIAAASARGAEETAQFLRLGADALSTAPGADTNEKYFQQVIDRKF